MFIQKHFTVVSFCLMVLTQNLYSQIVFQGVITDNGGEYWGNGAEPVANALVTLTDQADAGRSFSASTNEQGHYTIQITQTGVDDPYIKPGDFRLLQNYPNPFNPSTVIGYELPQPSHVIIEIYNVVGRKVKKLLDGFQSGSGHVVWDATDDHNQGVPAGVYIYSIKAGDVRINKKMLLIDGHRGSSNISMSQSKGTHVSSQAVLGKQMSDQYLLQVTGDDFETHEQQNLEITGNMTKDITVNRTVKDIDGNVYPTVKIGDQWWLAENLKVTHYRNGDAIPNVTDNAVWRAQSTGVYCNYDNDANNATIYGSLYNWYAVNDSRNIAPVGWHVPTDEEWKELEVYLGMSESAADSMGGRGTDEGGTLKETGTAHWNSPNTGATNESGFTALPGGFRNLNEGSFVAMGFAARFLIYTETSLQIEWARSLWHNGSAIGRNGTNKIYGYSVRCVRD